MISNETKTEIFVMKKFLFKSAKYRLWLLHNFSPFYSLNLNEMNRNETKTLLGPDLFLPPITFLSKSKMMTNVKLHGC